MSKKTTTSIKLSDHQKMLLDQRKQNHFEGKSKSYSWEQVKQRARAYK